MARPLRIEYEGTHYHVTTRGNERKAIFRSDLDREKFLELIKQAVEQFDLRLAPNHRAGRPRLNGSIGDGDGPRFSPG
jgi:REP element-mobilizing transposase RayT